MLDDEAGVGVGAADVFGVDAVEVFVFRFAAVETDVDSIPEKRKICNKFIKLSFPCILDKF